MSFVYQNPEMIGFGFLPASLISLVSKVLLEPDLPLNLSLGHISFVKFNDQFCHCLINIQMLKGVFRTNPS